jgi:hypothetical protein
MTTLADTLLAPERREALTADIVAVVEGHIARRAGLRGVALRAAMAAVRRQLPDAFARFLARDRAGAAEAMLAIADARVERSSNAALKAFYKGFRATAEHEAEDLVPGLADVLAKHL